MTRIAAQAHTVSVMSASFPSAQGASEPSEPHRSPRFPPMLALESIRDAFYVCDADWRIVFFNACAERHFGRTRAEVLGLTIWEIFPSAADSAFSAPFRAAMIARRPARVEAASVRGDGRWVEVEATPCGDGMSLQVRDIDERKRIEQRLVERESRLAEADRRKDEFLAMLSHEMRNPLAPLTNVLRLLERSDALGPAERGWVAVAERQRAQLARLVDDLLEVSRIGRGKIVLRPEPMSIPASVRGAVESIGPVVAGRGQRLQVAMPEAMADIVADPARVTQILENLLQNASKYTPHGGSIRIEAVDLPGEVEVRVSDDGIGIDPAHLETLFEPFVQLDHGLARSDGGLGIGLALVRRLAQLHGGSASAHSEGLARGACFTVRLPRAAATPG